MKKVLLIFFLTFTIFAQDEGLNTAGLNTALNPYGLQMGTWGIRPKQITSITLTANCDTCPILLGVGNSIMAGYPNLSDTANIFTRQVSTYMGWNDNNYSLNKGISGNTSTVIRARFTTDVINYQPRMVLLEGGINDFTANIFADSSYANIKAMIDALITANIPFVWIPIPPDDNSSNTAWQTFDSVNTLVNAYVLSVDGMIADVADLIGMERTAGSPTPTAGNKWDVIYPFDWRDNIHFIRIGNQMFARKIVDVLKTNNYHCAHDTAYTYLAHTAFSFAYKYDFPLTISATASCYLGVDSVYGEYWFNSGSHTTFKMRTDSSTNTYTYTVTFSPDTSTFSAGDTLKYSISVKGYKGITTNTYSTNILADQVPMAGLKLWVTSDTLVTYASDSTVSLWYDQSPNENNLFNNGVSNRPTYGQVTGSGNKAGITWGANSLWLELTTHLNLGTTNEFFIVLKGNGKANSILLGGNNSSNLNFAAGTTQWYNAEGSFGSSALGKNYSNRFVILHVWRNNSTTVNLEFNDTAHTAITLGGANANFLLDYIGDRTNGSTIDFGGVLCAVLVYNVNNTAGGITQIKNYLNTKYSVY